MNKKTENKIVGDRVKMRILPNGSKVSYSYDESGRVTGITQSTESGEENSTSIKYTLGLPTRLTSGNNVVYYEYDYKRRIKKVRVNGTETTYAYDDRDDKTTVTFAGTEYKTYKDEDGNVIRTEIDDNVQTEYVYEDGLLKRFEDKVTGEISNYEYNTNKTVSKISNAELTESYKYNDQNEIISKTYGGAITQEYGYTYKNNAAREIEYIEMPNGIKSYPLKDLNGRNTGKELKDVNGNRVHGEYISYVKVGDHATNMPSTVWYASGNEIKENIRYKYDACGNIVEIRENGKLTARYEYDGLNRLVREDNKKLGKTWVFGYDNNGNITSKREFAFTLRTRELLEELESTEKLYSYEGDRLITYNGEIISFDRYGNPIKYKGETLEWEYGKRLKKYGEKTYGYDGLGRRISKGEITFTYDNEGRLIKQSNGIQYIYDKSGVSGFRYERGEYIYRKNAQGDITHILDYCENIVAEYAYDAWGNCTIIKDTAGVAEVNPFRYRGYYYDVETGLYYLKTRYYDPEVGRFISQDDVSYLDPEHINGLNLYAYCGDNPVMFTDPTGEFAFLIGLLIVVGVCVAGGAAIGGISAAVNHENVLDGIWKGALVGLMVGGSITLVSTGVGTSLAGTFWGSVLVGGGIGSAFAIGTNLNSQLQKGGFGSLNIGDIALFGMSGLFIGGLAGGMGHAASAIFADFGQMLGVSLASKSFLGVTISKVISKAFLSEAVAGICGASGGLVGGALINYIANDAGLQDKSVPLWIGTILKLLFKK